MKKSELKLKGTVVIQTPSLTTSKEYGVFKIRETLQKIHNTYIKVSLSQVDCTTGAMESSESDDSLTENLSLFRKPELMDFVRNRFRYYSFRYLWNSLLSRT